MELVDHHTSTPATFLLLLLAFGRPLLALDLEGCVSALGMESGDIRDESIVASSSHNAAIVGPQNARLNRETEGGAWCPERQISRDVREHLEVRMDSLHTVTAVATQGRFGNGQGLEYTAEYALEYWRPGMAGWRRFMDRRGVQIFQGNVNTYSVVKRSVDPPVIATKIRFVPYSDRLRTVCMRVEIFGCPYADGLLSYSVPQGNLWRQHVDLTDRTYDGIRDDDGQLRNGIGQLADGRHGVDDFLAEVDGLEQGYDWVGWRNDSLQPDLPTNVEGTRPLEILFTFEGVRNFSAVHFHCSNVPSKGVQVFSSATFWFSVGGVFFERHQVVHFWYVADPFLERAHDVTVLLHHRLGRLLRVELTYTAPWILLSEVSFDSVPALGNYTEEEPPASPPIVSTALNEDALENHYVALVIGVLAAVILLLVLVILVIVARSRRRKTGTQHASNTVSVNMKDLGLTFSSGPTNGSSSLYDHVTKDCLDPPRCHDTRSSYAGVCCDGSSTSREYALPNLRHCTGPLLPDIRGTTGTSLYASIPSAAFEDHRDFLDLKEVPRGQLHVLEKVGDGRFGEVHLCRLEDAPDLIDVESSFVLVTARSLRPGAGHGARSAFVEEARLLSRLRNPNIAGVVGLCDEGPLLCLVVEHPGDDDLFQHLQKHAQMTGITFSHGCLIYLATQIASGMKYLSSLGLVHRDLAARNCLVRRSPLSIKISDLAASRQNLYANHYTRVGGALLPLRWMARESLATGKFSCKSDVWSFAVTLWEMLTFAQTLPHAFLSDDEVLRGRAWEQPLPQPRDCPREIYDLMRECWRNHEQDRPHFREIHLFLQRKNLGYCPPP